MKSPIWFLDIDGVINSIGAPLPESGVDTSLYSLVQIAAGPPDDENVWPIVFSSKVIDFINEVNRTGLAEVQWLTTWEDQARTRFAPVVSLDDFPAHIAPERPEFDWSRLDESGQPWWKETIVRQVLEGTDRPFVWTDDDLDRSVRDSIQRDFGRSSLMIRPSLNPGLNNEHLDAIRNFLERQRRLSRAIPPIEGSMKPQSWPARRQGQRND